MPILQLSRPSPSKARLLCPPSVEGRGNPHLPSFRKSMAISFSSSSSSSSPENSDKSISESANSSESYDDDEHDDDEQEQDASSSSEVVSVSSASACDSSSGWSCSRARVGDTVATKTKERIQKKCEIYDKALRLMLRFGTYACPPRPAWRFQLTMRAWDRAWSD
jgi:hypothetical protein